MQKACCFQVCTGGVARSISPAYYGAVPSIYSQDQGDIVRFYTLVLIVPAGRGAYSDGGMKITVAQSAGMVLGIAVAMACFSGAADQQAQTLSSSGDLVKAVIRNELNSTDSGPIRWRYLLNKDVEGKQETREVVETNSGSLERLIAIAGKPLSNAQQQDESERILKLARNPDKQARLEQKRRKDAQQSNAFLQMIPNAFLFEYAGESGELIKVVFKPNPQFTTSSREGKVLKEMQGEIWIHAKQQRIVSINGQLMNEVKFAGGLLGHLEKGGQFSVRRAEIAPGVWEVTELAVSMRGKAVLFKTICVQQKEIHSNFQRVPGNLTLAEAAGLLLEQASLSRQAVIAAKR
jgi:hypothetical protein